MEIFLASGNAHKADEFRQLLAQAPGNLTQRVRLHSAGRLGGMPAVLEDSGTFEGNALKKARALGPRLPAGAWALADDSGLCVEALGGAPGVESAYFAGPQGDNAANLQKLVEVLRAVPPAGRAAAFVCVLCLYRPDKEPRFFEGRCEGSLALEPSGGAGFGYDPLFVPTGEKLSFAQLGEAEKNRLSHRARAFTRLCEVLDKGTWGAGEEGNR